MIGLRPGVRKFCITRSPGASTIFNIETQLTSQDMLGAHIQATTQLTISIPANSVISFAPSRWRGNVGFRRFPHLPGVSVVSQLRVCGDVVCFSANLGCLQIVWGSRVQAVEKHHTNLELGSSGFLGCHRTVLDLLAFSVRPCDYHWSLEGRMGTSNDRECVSLAGLVGEGEFPPVL